MANEKKIIKEKFDDYEYQTHEIELRETSIIHAVSHPNPTTQLLLSSKLLIHRPEAGLNPIVDAAAYLFSMMGKLKHAKTGLNLNKLHKELIEEIQKFRELAEAYSNTTEYVAEYVPIACYALCVTLDDIISNTSWGSGGRWDIYSMVVAFNQEALSHKSFFIILERLIRDPAVYIDVMEFMYICLSLGFKCHYNSGSSEFDHEQLEQITDALYKRIRAFRGNFSKTLSPYSIKPAATPNVSFWDNIPMWLIFLVASSFLLILFAGTKIIFDRAVNQTYQHLAAIQKFSSTEKA